MIRETKVTLVGSTPLDPSSPPATLGKAGRTLWQDIQTEYQIGDSGGLEMLRQCASAVDEIAECGETIARDGLMVMTKAGPREHPLLKHQLALRAFVVRTLIKLGLNVEPLKAVGRPSSGIGWWGPAA